MFNREELKGSEIREQMLEGDDWQAHVPAPVREVIDEIDGIQRLQTVAQFDSAGET
jgi:nicotinamide-nucleotide adenylyltransferase